MKVGVVAVPWEAHRNTLFAVCGWARTWGHTLTVRTDLEQVPTWARYAYARWPTPLPEVDLVVWLADGTPPSAPWVLLDGSAALPAARWAGVPEQGTWERTDGTWQGHVLAVDGLEAWMQQLCAGRAAWPSARWAGPVLPGRVCPAAWWSPAIHVRPAGVLGVCL